MGYNEHTDIQKTLVTHNALDINCFRKNNLQKVKGQAHFADDHVTQSDSQMQKINREQAFLNTQRYQIYIHVSNLALSVCYHIL